MQNKLSRKVWPRRAAALCDPCHKRSNVFEGKLVLADIRAEPRSCSSSRSLLCTGTSAPILVVHGIQAGELLLLSTKEWKTHLPKQKVVSLSYLTLLTMWYIFSNIWKWCCSGIRLCFSKESKWIRTLLPDRSLLILFRGFASEPSV